MLGYKDLLDHHICQYNCSSSLRRHSLLAPPNDETLDWEPPAVQVRLEGAPEDLVAFEHRPQAGAGRRGAGDKEEAISMAPIRGTDFRPFWPSQFSRTYLNP